MVEKVLNFNGKVVPYRCMYDTDSYKIYKCVTKESFTLGEGVEITIAGDMPKLVEGSVYNVVAYPKETKYGVTYNITGITPDFANMDRNTFYKGFLASITSEALADVITNAYPDFVRLVLDGRDAEIDLSKINGVKEGRFSMIKNKIMENIKVIDVMDEYGAYGISFKLGLAIIKACNMNMDKVRERMDKDPYGLLTGIGGMGFIRADQFILKVRPELKTSEYRLYACVDHLLSNNESNDGSTWMYFKDLYTKCLELCPEATSNISKVVERNEQFYWDAEKKRIANVKTYNTEKFIASRLLSIRDSDSPMLDWGRKPDFEKFRVIDGRELTDEQMQVMSLMFESNVNILCGSAGTGKTSSLKAVLNMLDSINKSYCLVSPTGAASKVFTRSVSEPGKRRTASTIHKLLAGLEKVETMGDPICIPHDVLVVDEMSMCDIWTMARLLSHVGYGTKVLFVGDYRQLASVGVGNFSTDIIESEQFKISTLTKVFRFNEGGLTWVAQQSRVGKRFLPDEVDGKILKLGQNGDFVLIKSEKSKMLDEVVRLYGSLLNSGKGIMDIGVISAMNVNDLGANQINSAIQNIVTPNADKLKYGAKEFRLGDKVMQIVNSYEKLKSNGEYGNIFNGNKGVVIDIMGKDMLTVDFDGEQFIYEKDEIGELSLAYCTSVHKYQGDSAETIIFVTPSSHTFMLSRNLLYTGYTRASKILYNFIDKEATITTALRKSDNVSRNTFLLELLQKKDLTKN